MASNKEAAATSSGVRFDEGQPPQEPEALTVQAKVAADQHRRRLLQRPHTAAILNAGSSGAPFLDARGNRTQPSRDQPPMGEAAAAGSSTTNKKKRRRRRGRPKTALGIGTEQPHAPHPPRSANPAGGPAAAGSEPNFPALNPRVFQSLRGFLTPESLRKTKFYSDREDKMEERTRILVDQHKRLDERIRVFNQRLDTFIAETNAAKNWEPEDRRKQKSLLDNLDSL